MDLSTFEKKINVTFEDKELLKQAFTHRSYINENRGISSDHNERLEFLGDAVLELIVTDYLFKTYPKFNEGEMTAYRSGLVNANTLSDVAKKLEMNEYLLLSRGEAKDTGRARQYILANTFEALVGAMFIDQGYEKTREFVARNLFDLIDEMTKKGGWIDSKSLFQERAQEVVGITPSYTLIKEAGPDHDKSFTVGVYLNRELVATGDGRSKQDAEQEAAKKGLEVKAW